MSTPPHPPPPPVKIQHVCLGGANIMHPRRWGNWKRNNWNQITARWDQPAIWVVLMALSSKLLLLCPWTGGRMDRVSAMDRFSIIIGGTVHWCQRVVIWRARRMLVGSKRFHDLLNWSLKMIILEIISWVHEDIYWLAQELLTNILKIKKAFPGLRDDVISVN